MRRGGLGKIAGFLIACLLLATPARANDLINSNASGYVNGSIIQEASNGSSNTVEVGSIITGPYGNASNISVSAYVQGDIIVRTSGASATTVTIGSYKHN